MEKNKNNQQVLVAVPQITKHDFFKYVSDTLGTYRWPKGSIESIDPDKTRLVSVSTMTYCIYQKNR